MPETIEEILQMVSCETSISIGRIVSKCREQDVVSAKYIAAMLMVKSGIYAKHIAETLGVSLRNVYYIKQNFHRRMQWDKQMKVCYKKLLQEVQ